MYQIPLIPQYVDSLNTYTKKIYFLLGLYINLLLSLSNEIGV